VKSLPNIEKSGFRRGEYVGYANGVWRIRKDKPAVGWRAQHRETGKVLFGASLAELSTLLEQEAAK
jgi:hypothetical protein